VIDAVREALGDAPAWIVGGAVRDRLLGRRGADDDVDLVVEGDARAAARRIARAARGAPFELSDAFGAWRVVGPGQAWQVDVTPLQGGSLLSDLAARDLTVNAMAEPVSGGAIVDPYGGRADLAARRLRMVGPGAFAVDPLRTLRVARLACELGFGVEPETAAAARAHAGDLDRVSPERVFAELKRILVADDPLAGLELMDELGLTAVVLPEIEALHGVEQNPYHHRDVHGHTIEAADADRAARRADRLPPSRRRGRGARA
jgi:tRNA nucleotidyltransferase/poly(A) polymerase